MCDGSVGASYVISSVCPHVQLGYLLVVGKAEVEGGDQWVEQMGLRLVVCHKTLINSSSMA